MNSRKWNIAVICVVSAVVLLQHPLAADIAFETMLKTLLRHSVPEVRTPEVRAAARSPLLDARARREFDISHLPNAGWVGYEDLTPERLGSIAKDATVIVYCSGG